MVNQKVPETLSWRAPSHISPKRSSGWYLAFSLVFLFLLGYAIYIKSLITFLTFFLIMVVVLVISTQKSFEKTYKITKTGIAVGRVLYPFKIIKKFWIVYNPPQIKTLNFETTAYINNQVILQLGHQDPIEVKLVLGQYLPEDLEIEESITETLARRLKI